MSHCGHHGRDSSPSVPAAEQNNSGTEYAAIRMRCFLKPGVSADDSRVAVRKSAFSLDAASFCYWRRSGDDAWTKVSGMLAQDGADDLLLLLTGGPSAYQQWAQAYYEVAVSAEITEAVFRHQPLTEAMILALNADAVPAQVYAEAAEIAYPAIRS